MRKTFDECVYTVKLSIYLQEELARKRELPVPPVPKRSGVWAKSNEDLQGDIFYF